MWKVVLSTVIFLTPASMASAQTVTDPDQIASRLHFWAQEAGEPVYYGEVRNVDPRTMRVGGHYQCLALAFIKYEGGVFHYAHKMWGKSPDGSCHYDDVTSLKVSNHGACVKDTTAGFGRAVGTARMSKANIDYEHSRFRTIDLHSRQVGETAACVPPKGVGAGLRSMKIENGRFKLMTTRPLEYEVNIEPQDRSSLRPPRFSENRARLRRRGVARPLHRDPAVTPAVRVPEEQIRQRSGLRDHVQPGLGKGIGVIDGGSQQRIGQRMRERVGGDHAADQRRHGRAGRRFFGEEAHEELDAVDIAVVLA